MDKHRAEGSGKGTPSTADSAGMLYNVDARRDRSISRQDMTIANLDTTISRSAISLMMVAATLYGVGLIVHRRSRIVPQRSLPPLAATVWPEMAGMAVIVMMPLGGVWVGLAGVVHVALNRINCEENQENTLVNEFLLLNLHAINFKNTYVIICCR